MAKRSFEVTCPHCGSLLSFEERDLPESTEICPQCHQAFLLETPEDPLGDNSFPFVPDSEEDPVNNESSDDELRFWGVPSFTLIVSLSCVAILLAAGVLFLLNAGHRLGALPEGSIAGRESAEPDSPKEPSLSHEDYPLVDANDSPAVPENPDQDETDEDEIVFPPDDIEKIEENQFAEFEFPRVETGISSDSNLSVSENSASETSTVTGQSDDSQTASETITGDPETIRNESLNSPVAEDSNDRPEMGREERAEEKENFDDAVNSDGDMTVLFSTMSQSQIEPINVTKRLDLNVRQIRLAHAGLADYIRLFYQLTGIPVQLDWCDIAEPIAVWEKRIPYEAANLSASQFLDEFSTSFGLEVSVQDDRVLLSYPQEGDDLPSKATFDCSDLIENDSETESPPQSVVSDSDSVFPDHLSLSILEKALRDLVLDPTLISAKISPTLEFDPDGKSMSLSADMKTIERAYVFLDRLRSLRHLPPKRIIDAETLIPENLCWENKLSAPVSLCFLRSVPLWEALLLMEREYQIHFFFDYAALPGGGAVLETPVRLIAENQPMERVLSQLLGPLGVEYFVLTEDLLAVSTSSVGEVYDAEIHFYAVPEDDISLEEASGLANRIRESIDPESWHVDSRPGGKIWIDPQSHSFYIRQTLSNQIKIRRLLQSGLVGKEISL